MITYRQGAKVDIPEIKGTPNFHVKGLDGNDYGRYDQVAVTRYDNQFQLHCNRWPGVQTPQWIRDEQIKWGKPVHDFTHITGGLESDKTFRPPFHVQVRTRLPYRSDILPSVWLLNDCDKNPTRELDMFETGFSWKPRIWFADHTGAANYENRVMYKIEPFLVPCGMNQYDLFVSYTDAKWYVNGRLIKFRSGDWNYDYRLLVTLIVCRSTARDYTWEIEKIAVEADNVSCMGSVGLRSTTLSNYK